MRSAKGGKAPPFWVVAIEVPKGSEELFAAAFAKLSDTYSYFEAADGSSWQFEAILETEPDRAALEAHLFSASDAAGFSIPKLTIERLPDKDWLAENRKQFPPTVAGRFFIHGSYFEGRVPPGRIVLELDAGLAFGTGAHESTRGCLLALERLARRRCFRRPLDLGTGSGILSIGMAKLWRVPITSVDIDPVAVAVARANAQRNRVAKWVRPVVSNGLRARRLRGGTPYNLIVANILARPLERLAPALARARSRDGVLILSGILTEQTPGVLAAYRAQGLALERRLVVGRWATLVIGSAGPRRSVCEATAARSLERAPRERFLRPRCSAGSRCSRGAA